MPAWSTSLCGVAVLQAQVPIVAITISASPAAHTH
jgi:hypothetical protein